jgi:GTP-binding protein LepA
MSNIRNFVIIAHVDHGKSTLADRFLELTGTVEARRMKAQYLDQLELERERGITIKMAPVRMTYHSDRGLTQMEERMNADNDSANKRGLLYEDLTYKIRGAAFNVYNALGSGHKEGIYQNALALEFGEANLSFEREKRIDVVYDGEKVGLYQPDFVVEGKIIIELKAIPFLGNPPKKQTQYYLKGSDYRLALLVNFGGKNLEIERIIYDSIRDNQPINPRASASSEYILNLIDTPGHSDFSYEVSRALAAVEGGILLVDATQGIQAQTLANFHAAKAAGLTLIGAVNKVDLFHGGERERLERVVKDVAELLGVAPEEVARVSGKTGEGVKELLGSVIRSVPPPTAADPSAPPRALIFDSFYDDHKGVVASVRVFEGEIRAVDDVRLLVSGAHSKLKELGYFAPELRSLGSDGMLRAGDIGYLATGLRDPAHIKIGDTVITNKHKLPTNLTNNISEIRGSLVKISDVALPGYKEPQSVVFVSFYPEDPDDYELLVKSLEKLRLNDSALTAEPDQNEVLGRGFKVGFLGRLHFEIVAERLRREFGVRTVNTFPSVAYRVKTKKGEWKVIVKPEDLPPDAQVIEEPLVMVAILASPAQVGNLMPLQAHFRMHDVHTEILGARAIVRATMPLMELVSDFDDQLKSATSGYASFSYELAGYAPADVVMVSILISGELVPGLSRFFSRDAYEREARKMVERLKKLLPRRQFAQALQAAAEGRIIAREDIPALRKDVTGYLYGGDRTRKMKLWQKQKRGKERLKARAEATIPPEVFKELLKK